jgi:hypothetical protein
MGWDTSRGEEFGMAFDLVPGAKFPDLALPDHTGTEVHLSEITRGKDPLAVIFYRGWY